MTMDLVQQVLCIVMATQDLEVSWGRESLNERAYGWTLHSVTPTQILVDAWGESIPIPDPGPPGEPIWEQQHEGGPPYLVPALAFTFTREVPEALAAKLEGV
jgi:hypothetical protein